MVAPDGREWLALPLALVMSAFCISSALWAFFLHEGDPHLASHMTASQAASPQRETIAGTEILWQLPAGGAAKALLFLAHGCSHSMTDFWPQDAGSCGACRRCCSCSCPPATPAACRSLCGS